METTKYCYFFYNRVYIGVLIYSLMLLLGKILRDPNWRIGDTAAILP